MVADARSMKKACPRSGRVCDTACTECKPVGKYGTRNPARDLVAHNRWARAVKKRDGYRCQGPGPHGGPLHAHHTHGIHDERGVTLCAKCHRMIDRHATA
jgi:hypothetical protein